MYNFAIYECREPVSYSLFGPEGVELRSKEMFDRFQWLGNSWVPQDEDTFKFIVEPLYDYPNPMGDTERPEWMDVFTWRPEDGQDRLEEDAILKGSLCFSRASGPLVLLCWYYTCIDNRLTLLVAVSESDNVAVNETRAYEILELHRKKPAIFEVGTS